MTESGGACCLITEADKRGWKVAVEMCVCVCVERCIHSAHVEHGSHVASGTAQ